MAVQENHLDGPNGTAITPATSQQPNNSRLYSVTTNGLTITYDTSQKMHGTSAALFDCPTSGTSSGYMLYAISTTQVAFRAYIRLTSAPTAITNIAQTFHSLATASVVNIRNDMTFGWSYVGPNGAAANGFVPASTFTFQLNTWYRIEGEVNMSASGSIYSRIYAGDSTTPLASFNPSGLALNDSTNTPLQRFQFGKNNSSPVVGDFWMDDVAINTDSLTAMGPYVPEPPSVLATSNLSGSSLTLSEVATTYDNATPTFLWTQTAGPALTLSSTTAASPTATVTVAGSYTFKIRVTDDLGKTAEASTSFTYAGSTVAPGVTGPATALANQWVEIIVGSPTAGGAMSYSISPSTGVTQAAPGVFYGATPTTATTYTVTATEAGNANTQTFRFNVAPQSTQLGGLRILVATNDQSSGGSFT